MRSFGWMFCVPVFGGRQSVCVCICVCVCVCMYVEGRGHNEGWGEGECGRRDSCSELIPRIHKCSGVFQPLRRNPLCLSAFTVGKIPEPQTRQSISVWAGPSVPERKGEVPVGVAGGNGATAHWREEQPCRQGLWVGHLTGDHELEKNARQPALELLQVRDQLNCTSCSISRRFGPGVRRDKVLFSFVEFLTG